MQEVMKEKMGSEDDLHTDILSNGSGSPLEEDPKNPLRWLKHTPCFSNNTYSLL